MRLAIGLAQGLQRSKVGPVRAIGATPLERLRPADVDDLVRRCGSIGSGSPWLGRAPPVGLEWIASALP